MKKLFALFLSVLVLSLAACGGGPGVDVVVGANYYLAVKDAQGNSSFAYGSWLPAGSTVTLLDGAVKSAKVPDSNGILVDDMIGPARLANGKEVFISRYYLLSGQRLGVIVAADKAPVYDGLKAINVTATVLPRLTLIGVAPVEEKDNPLQRQRFIALAVPQAGGGKAFSAGIWTPFYVDPVNVSTAPADVEMAKLIAGLPKKDKSLWGKIVVEAEKQYPDSAFLADAKAMIGEVQANAAPKMTEAVSPLSARVNKENVALRSAPEDNTGNVIGQLGQDYAATIVAQTVDSYTVQGVSGRWYKVKAGDQEGWVFGADLAVE